jgi:hypothetical protein
VSEPAPETSTSTPAPVQTTAQTNDDGITVITEGGGDHPRKRVPPPPSN